MKKEILMPVTAIVLAALILLGCTLCLNATAAANAQATHLQLMQTLLPGSEHFTLEPYTGEDDSIRSVHRAENGFVIETVTRGYAGDITMLIGVDLQGKVMGLVVQDLSETFGLGSQALTDHEFLSQFLNSNQSFAIASADAFTGATGETAATGDECYVDAISGATVTSKAVVRCVNAAVSYVTGADTGSGATSWGG